MFPTTPDSTKPNNESSIVEGENLELAPVRFETLEAFSQWMAEDLALVIAKHEDFETANSLRGFFKRD